MRCRTSLLTALTVSLSLTACTKCSNEKSEEASTSAAQSTSAGTQAANASADTASQSQATATPAAAAQTSAPASAADPNAPTMPSSQTTKLEITDLTEGNGAVAEDNKKVTVHYTGWLTNGTKFDSSRDRGQPFEFVLGTGRVIPGWDQGLKGMKVGGKRKLVIPANLAYGDKGVGGVIPPNATLVFEVELLKVE